MKHILFVTRLFAPHRGGVETHVEKVAEKLSASGYKLTILTEQFDENLTLKERLQQVKVIRIPKRKLKLKVALWQWMWMHRQLFDEADIVHIHDVFWWIVPLLPRVRHKLFITFHGWEGVFPPKKSAIVQRRFAAKSCRGVIQVGDFIQKWYGTKPDLVTYGAGSERSQKKDVRVQYDVVFVGRLERENDLEKVIAFWTLYKTTHPKAKILWCGDGVYRATCERFGEVTGMVANFQDYLPLGKLVVANSYLSMLEAMVARKLVISFYSHALKRDYLTLHPQAKQMIISNSSVSAMKSLEQVLQNTTQLADRVRIAHSWASEQTWEQLSKAYLHVWERKRFIQRAKRIESDRD